MTAYKKTFVQYLENNQSRLTPQKEAIVDEIYKTRTHFEVDDFLAKLNLKKSKFSRATAYRTIKQLLDANLLQKVTTQDGKVFYEKSVEKKQHDHLICNSCGKILEIKDSVIDKTLLKQCKNLSFQPEYRSLHIYGKCKRCQKT